MQNLPNKPIAAFSQKRMVAMTKVCFMLPRPILSRCRDSGYVYHAMKMIPRQKFWLAFVILVNLLLWLIPSDVVELIARQRDVLLGRYSKTHFYWIVGVGILSLLSFYVDWSTGETYKRRWFQAIAFTLFFIPAFFLVDFVLRTPDEMHYSRNTFAYRRPANFKFEGVWPDKPEPAKSFPNAPTGFPEIRGSFSMDARGYRNPMVLEQAEIVTLGDSFAEGSKVSDEHPWPLLLAQRTGHSVYNLGMSGYDPLHYRESLKDIGLALKPKVVICMLYEGNDFRSASADKKRLDPSLSKRFADYMDHSPLLKSADQLMIRTFGPLRADAPVRGIEMLDWLPLTIPAGAGAKYYAFEPKQLRDLYGSAEEFEVDKHWLNPRAQIKEMYDLTTQAGATFVLTFAPTKAHVVLPLAGTALPADKVKRFTAISYDEPLPDGPEFLATLLSRLDAREQVIGSWCARENISFVSLTSPLREAAQAGRQVYYTYDQHWSPEGHAVVAEALSRFLKEPAVASREAS